MRQCKGCDKYVTSLDGRVKYCDFCQEDRSNGSTRFCSKCDKPNSADTKMCETCKKVVRELARKRKNRLNREALVASRT